MSRPDAFLVIAPSGRVLAVEDSHAKAARAAAGMSPGWVDLSASPDAQQNPPAGPERALENSGLIPVSWEEVASIPLKAALAMVLPHFAEANAAARAELGKFDEKGRWVDGRGVSVSRSTLLGLGKGLLADNTKLIKKDKRAGVPTFSLGLALLPEAAVFRGGSEAGEPLKGVQAVRAKGRVPRLRSATLCDSSSSWCRKTCLVFSGQNQSDRRNNYTKFARTKALLEDTPAFMRVLASALSRYSIATKIKKDELIPGTLRFCRLNVLSDIPWELVAPWLFDSGGPAGTVRISADGEYLGWPNLNFYDYTKVPGRRAPNYDLSFSFSGGNLSDCNKALQRKQRIVIPFASADWVTGSGAKRRKRGVPAALQGTSEAYFWLNPLPAVISDPKLMGGRELAVLDGDLSDIRPLDPAPSVVGLRFKPPMVKMKGLKGSQKAVVAGPFVVNGHYMPAIMPDGQQVYAFATPLSPLSQPISSETVGGKSVEV